jgi:low temperature requirement protein LtrA
LILSTSSLSCRFFVDVARVNWILVSAVPWFAGAAASVDNRIYWWAVAIALEFFSRWLLYWTPGLGASKPTDWTIDGAHVAERCGLFFMGVLCFAAFDHWFTTAQIGILTAITLVVVALRETLALARFFRKG